MLSSGTAAPNEGRFRLESVRQLDAPALDEVWSCFCSRLDAAVYRMFVNAVYHEFEAHVGSMGISIRSVTSGPPIEVHMKVLRETPCVAMRTDLPFEIDDNLLDPLRKCTMFRVEFREPMSDEVLDHVGTRLAAWQQALMLGCYVDPTQNGGQTVPAYTHADWYRISTYSGEYSIFNCAAPRESVNLIVNLFAHVHHHIAPITAVECE